MSRRSIRETPHPTTIAGDKRFWGDAADVNRFVLNGQGVQTSYSKTTSNLIFTQNVALNQPQRIGEELVWDDIGNNQWLNAGSQYWFVDSSHSGVSLFFLVRSFQDGASVFTPFSGVKFIFDFGNYNTKGFGILYARNHLGCYTPTSNGGALTEKFPLDNPTEDYVVVTAVIKFGDSQKLYLNGELVAQSAISLTQLTGLEINESSVPTTSSGPVSFGSGAKSNLGSNRWFHGAIKNWIFMDEAVTDVQRLWIERYLQQNK